MNEHELPAALHEQISTLCKRGDELFRQGDDRVAYETYAEAWELIPEPKINWQASTWVLAALAEIKFRRRQYEEAKNLFLRAVQGPEGLGNAYIHLRIGQIQYEAGNIEGAKDNLARAFMGGGLDIFSREDEKYLTFLRQYLEAI